MPHPRIRDFAAAFALLGLFVAACDSGSAESEPPLGSGAATDGGSSGDAAPSTAATGADITALIVQNQNVALSGAATIVLPPGVTTYSGVISGGGTLVIQAAGGTSNPSTLIITKTWTVALPDAQQVETVTKSIYPGAGYALDISGSNPPVVTVNPGVTFQIGTNGSADDHPGILCTSDSKNPASVVGGEVNLDNLEINGALVLNSAQFILLGEISGTGPISQLPNVWGGSSLGGANSFTGILSLSAGQDFGTDHVPVALGGARAVLNEGSWLVWSPANHVSVVSEDIYEASFGNDVNFHPIGNARIVMTGVYSHTDNSPHGAPNFVNPGLSDPALNLAKVIYRGGANDVNGNDGSYRGVNIEAEGTVQWGDGTTNHFFLPSAPSPADVTPPLGNKNAYINLRRGGTLAFDYNAPVTLNVGITGGGGGPHKTGEAGVGNVTIMGTAGNDVTFAQPQDYNGTTTIENGAVLHLGTGTAVPLSYVTVNASGQQTKVLHATYTGDSSLLTAESSRGAATDQIVNNGAIVVNNTTTAITLSHMSGTGTFTQAGPANVTVLANSYRGGTVILGGALLVADDDALGTGDVENEAVLSPAPERCAIRVRGNYAQGSAGTLRLQSGSNGSRDGLHVTGRATLDGTVEVVRNRTIRSGERFTVVRATEGITGRFRSAVINGVPVPVRCDGTTCTVTAPRPIAAQANATLKI